MSWVLRLVVLVIFGAAVLPAYASEDAAFDRWAVEFKQRAVQEGISAEVVERAFEGVEPDPIVVKLDRKQPEGQVTLAKYLSNTVTKGRITRGRELMDEHKDLLRDISRTYGVQPKFIVALWGIESNYGVNPGSFSVVRSLATLAYEGRRRDFFSNELIAALKIIEAEHMDPSELIGSWAGAMGDCQFMPSTYLRHAADGDNDGHRDIWNSTPDALASIASYLHSLKWNDELGWGVPVTLPEGFSEAEADIKHTKTAREWRKRGLEWAEDDKQFGQNAALSAIYADKPNLVAYLVTENYKATLQWNRSRYFATAVGTLADQLAD